ncbi:hypothetical protein T492DRAFT_926841, partial [Pavlovales sp. CCMP2436]
LPTADATAAGHARAIDAAVACARGRVVGATLAAPDDADTEARRALRVVGALDRDGAGALAGADVLAALRLLLGDLVRKHALKLGPIAAECKRAVPPDLFGRLERTAFVRWWLRSEWVALARYAATANEPPPASGGAHSARVQGDGAAAACPAFADLAATPRSHRDNDLREWGQDAADE